MKTMKKIFCIFLVVLMCLTSAPLSGFVGLDFKAEATTDYKVGDIIQFGSYPQSEVKDSATINALNARAPEWDNWTSYGYYSGTGDYGTMVQGDWMRYIDVTYNGNKYRGVKFTQYRPYWTCDTSSYTYQDDNGYSTNTVYWFKFELIDWRVLDPATGLVMCEIIIDSQPYSNTIYYNGSAGPRYNRFNDASYTNYASDYETSSIRQWLNDDFYNTAFTDSEKKEINTTTLNNDGYYTSVGKTGYEKLDSNSTNDKIFLLSYNEVRNSDFGFDSNQDEYDKARQAQGSDYAKSQGLWVSTSSSDYGNSYWLLRSPGTISDFCCQVNCSGYSGSLYGFYRGSHIGVRPALKLNLGSEIVNPDNPNDTDNTTESDTPVKVTVTGTLEEYKISTVIIVNGSEYYDYVSEITIDGNKYTIKDSTLIPITSVEDFINKKVTVDIEDGIVTTFKNNEESDDDNNGFGENDGSSSNGNPDTKPQISAYDTLVEYKQNVDFDKRKKFTINGKIINYNEEHTLTDISITIKSSDANKAVFKTENGYEASVTFPLGETIEAGKDRDFKCTAYIKRGYNPPNGTEDLTFTCILHGKLNGKEINGVYRTFNVKIKNLSYESQDNKNWTPTSLIGLLDILFTSKTPKGNLYIDCYPNKSAASTLKWQYTSIKATNAITSTIELSDELSKRLDVAIKLTELGNISALKINDVVLGIGEEALDQVMDAYQDKAMNEIKKFYDGEIKRLLESKEYKEYLEWYSREVNHINGNSIKVTQKCPIDIYVTDEEGCNILKIEDSYIKVFDEYASAYLSGEDKILYLPNDIGHSIKTVATDNGEMDYIIESYSKQGEYRIIEYNNIPLLKGKSYTATVPLDMTSNIDMFNPKSEDGKIIKVDKDETEHKYGDKDKNCQFCGFDRTEGCSCSCHKNGIAKFFFNFILFFQKLFKANKICKCGINHY